MLLEKRLKQLGMTKKDLAEALGITPESVYRWDTPPKYALVYLDMKETVDKADDLVQYMKEKWNL